MAMRPRNSLYSRKPSCVESATRNNALACAVSTFITLVRVRVRVIGLALAWAVSTFITLVRVKVRVRVRVIGLGLA